jgi:hypothetical protein
MCTHPCSTHQTPHPQVVNIATPVQEKMKLWKETTRSSKIMMSSRRGLAVTPSRLPLKAAFIYVLFSRFDYCKDYVDVSDIWCNRLLFPFLILFEHYVMMSMLCNWCVRELMILARTWFAFDLPSKTGCDTVWYVRVLCRVPVIRHSAKFFLILKYALSSARSLALGKAVFAECPLGDTRQRLSLFFVECHPADTRQSLLCRVSTSWHSAKYICIFLFSQPKFLWCVSTLCRPTCTILGQL